MNHKFSFNQYLLAGMILTQSFGADVFAGWHCPQGQPDACINETNALNDQYRNILKKYYEMRDNTDNFLKKCDETHALVKSAYEHSLKMYERISGRLESLKEQQKEYKKLFIGQQNQVQIINQIQSVHLNYIRQMIQALKEDINRGGYSIQLDKYRNDLLARKSVTSNQTEKTAIDLTIGMVDEITSIMKVKSSGTTSLHNRLLGEINRYDSKLTELSKKSIEYALNGTDLGEVSLSGLISLASVNANTLFSLYQKNLDRIVAEIRQSESELSTHSYSIKYNKEKIIEVEKVRNEYGDYLLNQLPSLIREHEAKLNGNIAFLNNDGCRKKHCQYSYPGDWK